MGNMYTYWLLRWIKLYQKYSLWFPPPRKKSRRLSPPPPRFSISRNKIYNCGSVFDIVYAFFQQFKSQERAYHETLKWDRMEKKILSPLLKGWLKRNLTLLVRIKICMNIYIQYIHRWMIIIALFLHIVPRFNYPTSFLLLCWCSL